MSADYDSKRYSMSQLWFATCAPGLEEALLAEVRELGGRKARALTGGVEFDASNKSLYSLLYRIRGANRLYMRVDEFRARDLPEIYNKTRRIDWERLVGADHRIALTAYSIESRETHTDKIAESVAFAITEHFEEDLGVEAPEVFATGDDVQLLMARVEDNRCTLNLDASGELLFRRGWRTEQGEAPLRESYGAALLQLLEWTPDEPLVDPMCGSGTIAVEAATIAANRPPGSYRNFAIETWANFREETWKKVNSEPPVSPDGVTIVGRDADDEVVSVARANADRAVVAELVAFDSADVSTMEPPAESGLVLTNAPYGVRIEDAMDSIHALCERFDTRFSGWRMGVLVHRDVTLPLPNKRVTRLADFRNGGIPVRLWGVDL